MGALSEINALANRDEFNSVIMSEVLADLPMRQPNMIQLVAFCDKFLPLTVTGETGNIQLITNSAQGMMEAYNSGDIVESDLPGMDALRYSGELSFAGSVVFNKKDLEEINAILKLRGLDTTAGKVAAALSFLKIQFEQRRAGLVRDMLMENKIEIDSNGVTISETGLFGDATHSPFHLDLTITSPETGYTDVRELPTNYAFEMESTNYYWNQANAKILQNLTDMFSYITGVLQRTIVKTYIPPQVMRYVSADSEVRDWVKRYGDTLVTGKSNIDNGKDLRGYPHEQITANYLMEKEITAAVTVGSDTTITVNNTTGIEDNTPCIITPKNSKNKYYGNITSATGTIVTLDDFLQGAGTIPIGSKIQIMVPIVSANKIVVELGEKTTQFTAVPTILAGSIERPGMGYFADTEVSPLKSKPSLKIFAGFEGRIDAGDASFVTLRVLA